MSQLRRDIICTYGFFDIGRGGAILCSKANHADEREKTADDQNKLMGVTDLNGRPTNVVWSFH